MLFHKYKEHDIQDNNNNPFQKPKNNHWATLEEGLAMFTPDFMVDECNQSRV